MGFSLKIFGLAFLLAITYASNKRPFPLDVKNTGVVVDTRADLSHSACNSGGWFQYASESRNLARAPAEITGNFQGAKGVWLLQKSAFKGVTFDNQFPCLDWSASSLLYEKMEIVYAFKSSGSNFSVYDQHNVLLAFVNKTSTNLNRSPPSWDVLAISATSPTTFHGVTLKANIEDENDYLLLDKVAAFHVEATRL